MRLEDVTVSGNVAAGGEGHSGSGGFTSGNGGDALGGGIRNFGTLTLVDSTVSGNTAQGGAGKDGAREFGHGGVAYGGGVYSSGRLTVSQSSTISGNAAAGGDVQGSGTANDGHGGGIYSTGSLVVGDSALRGNTARGGAPGRDGGDGSGGAIESSAGSVDLQRTMIAGNAARAGGVGGAGYGGGLALMAGTMNVLNSTLTANTAQGGSSSGEEVHGRDGRGGAIINSGTLSIANSTLTGNAAQGGSGGGTGAGGAIDNSRDLTVTASTLASNRASGAGADLFTGGGSAVARLRNSIVVGGGDAACAGAVGSRGYNLEDGNSCGLNQPGDIRNADPKLGTLADNGGATQTRSLPAASPAVDQGVRAGLGDDQRGRNRPVIIAGTPHPPGGDGSDIGAYELQASESPVIVVDPPVVAFAPQKVGTFGDVQRLTLTSHGRQDLKVSSVRTAGAAADDFHLLDPQSCTDGPLPSDKSCTVRVRFEPSELHARNATISIESNARTSPDSVTLFGIGTSAETGER